MKKCMAIFIAACLAVCLIPFAGMAVFPTTQSTENKKMSEFPSLITDSALNTDYFSEFEDYFNEHFTLRNELVWADAVIQTKVFGVSNIDTVIYGTDGWLYYASTLGDYLGTGQMTEREIYNTAHNLRLVSGYIEEKGAAFVLTIPPNKNTLYGEHMPYYASYIVEGTHNADLLSPLLLQSGISYADLFGLFRSTDEVLYLKRDSHWNRKGALMAYNCIMDTLGYTYDDYSGNTVTAFETAEGDLNRMLYTFYGKSETDYDYGVEQNYAYVNDVDSVEDGWIETRSSGANGTLLMFRDSFANTLIPLIAGQFERAYFTKGAPYSLESYMEKYSPDTVIFEKVERNLSDYITMPPIISAPRTELTEEAAAVQSDTTIAAESLEYDYNYYKIYGSVDETCLGDATDIIVEIDGDAYEAYHIGVNEYAVYIKKEALQSFPVQIDVLTKDGDEMKLVQSKMINEGDITQ